MLQKVSRGSKGRQPTHTEGMMVQIKFTHTFTSLKTVLMKKLQSERARWLVGIGAPPLVSGLFWALGSC